MARVTVEDCLDKVDNRFQLVLLATKRARQISLGSEPMVEEENDKPTVLALREIADGHITRDFLNDEIKTQVLDFITEDLDSNGEESTAESTEVDALTAALQAELASESS